METTQVKLTLHSVRNQNVERQSPPLANCQCLAWIHVGRRGSFLRYVCVVRLACLALDLRLETSSRISYGLYFCFFFIFLSFFSTFFASSTYPFSSCVPPQPLNQPHLDPCATPTSRPSPLCPPPSRFSLAYIRHPSLMLECRSLMPTLTRRTPAVLFLLGCDLGRPLLSAPGESALAPLITGATSSAGLSKAKTSTIHSYHTFRSSVCRYMVTTTSPLSGTLRGV